MKKVFYPRARFLHVWYMIGLVDSAGRTNSIPMATYKIIIMVVLQKLWQTWRQ